MLARRGVRSPARASSRSRGAACDRRDPARGDHRRRGGRAAERDRRPCRQRRVLRPRLAASTSSRPTARGCTFARTSARRASATTCACTCRAERVLVYPGSATVATPPRRSARARRSTARCWLRHPGGGVHAAAVRLSVPLRPRAVVRAEGGRRARELPALLHRPTTCGRRSGPRCGSRCPATLLNVVRRAADRLQDAREVALPAAA